MLPATQIKKTLSMSEVAERYGYVPNRSGYLRCPFHADKTGSLKIYDHGFYCFGCGAGSSVIDFVMQLFNLDFQGAVARLDADFNLGLTDEKPDHTEMRRLQQQRQARQGVTERRAARYSAVLAEHRRLWRNYITHAPQSLDDEWDDEFCEALQKLERIEYWLEVN
jgi:DNA primase